MNNTNNDFYLVPRSILEELREGNSQILSILKSDPNFGRETLPGDYISEGEAKKLLNKKTTWFWNMRQSGQLPFSKIGSTNYYSRQDILKILNANHSSEK